MKLGFNLLLWTTHVLDEHVPLFERLKATGYHGVEIPLFEGDVAHYERLGRNLKDAGLGSSAVTVLPTGKSAIAAEATTRSLALDHLRWAIDCTAALGANVLCGPFHQPLGEFSGQGPTEAEKSHCVEVHKQAAQYAARSGINLSVEPLNRFECYFLNTARDAEALVKRVAEPNYGYLYDTFHFNIEEKNLSGSDSDDSASNQSRPHLRKRPRSPRQRPHRFRVRVRCPQTIGLRRLAYRRSIWPGVTRPCGGYQGLAAALCDARGCLRRGLSADERRLGEALSGRAVFAVA